MIGSISSTALMGLRNGLDSFDSAASKVTRATTAALNPGSSISSTPSVSTGSDVLSSLNESSVSLEESMTDLLLAKRFVQGQVGVIQTEDEMLADVIQMGRRRDE